MKQRFLYVTAGLMLVTGIAVLIAAAALTLAVDGKAGTDIDLAIGTPLPTLVPTETAPPSPQPSATPTPPQGDPQLASLSLSRLVLPTLGVDAPVVSMGIQADGTMESPRGPEEVAWYTFSAKPGQIGNVVMSGHLDYINYGAAVFWRLRDLRPGDEMQIVLEDGTVVRYAVESLTVYDEATAPVAQIVGKTPNESITLITCAGSFDAQNLLYNKRLVVRGARILT